MFSLIHRVFQNKLLITRFSFSLLYFCLLDKAHLRPWSCRSWKTKSLSKVLPAENRQSVVPRANAQTRVSVLTIQYNQSGTWLTATAVGVFPENGKSDFSQHKNPHQTMNWKLVYPKYSVVLLPALKPAFWASEGPAEQISMLVLNVTLLPALKPASWASEGPAEQISMLVLNVTLSISSTFFSRLFNQAKARLC